jgi:hypothetical protein
VNTSFEARILVAVDEISGSYLAFKSIKPILENDPKLISTTQGEIQKLEGIYF